MPGNAQPPPVASPLRVGLTGGIASGKSLVADEFAALGVDIVDTDVIARQVVEPGQPALEEIRAAFGDSVIRENGALNRRALRRIVFADDAKRRRLERLLHPRIREAAERQAGEISSPYHIIVVPLLAKSPMRADMDRILVVDCSVDTQLSRLRRRDSESAEQARRIIEAQATREERLAIADDVIDNDDSIEHTREQVALLHRKYLSLVDDSA